MKIKATKKLIKKLNKKLDKQIFQLGLYALYKLETEAGKNYGNMNYYYNSERKQEIFKKITEIKEKLNSL